MSANNNHQWTDDRVALLKELYAKGLSCRDIAKEMGGVSRNAVIGKIGRMGLNLPAGVVPVKAGRPRKAPKPPEAPKIPQRRMTNFGRHFSVLDMKFDKEAKQLPPDQSANPQPLFALEPHHCRWPISGEAAATLFCADQKHGEFSYCARHCRMAYQAPQRSAPAFTKTYVREDADGRKPPPDHAAARTGSPADALSLSGLQ